MTSPKPESTTKPEDKKPVAKKFVQLYMTHLPFLSEIIKQDALAGRVLLLILYHMGKDNKLEISQAALAQAMGVSDRSIRTAVACLKDNKAVITKRVGSSTTYTVNAQVAWKAKTSKRHAASFSVAAYKPDEEPGGFELVTQYVKRTTVRKAKRQSGPIVTTTPSDFPTS